MSEKEKDMQVEMEKTWHDMKEVMESRDQQDAETVETLKKFNERLDEIETGLRRPYSSGLSAVTLPCDQKLRETFLKAIRFGYVSLDKTERQMLPIVSTADAKALALSDDSAGGWLAYPELVQEIIKGIVLFSPVRGLAQIRQTSNRSIRQPVRTGVFAARWVSEVGTRSETTGLKYGMEDVPNHELYAEVIISEQDLEDSAFDIEQEILNCATEQFGVAEGIAFINGNAVGQPEGFMTNATVLSQFTVSGDANLLTGDGLINAYYDLPEAYARNATWVMKRATVAKIRTLKAATTGEYLWSTGFSPAGPVILGTPYVECPDMPAVAAGAFPIALADFRRGYVIVDRVNVVVKRLVEKYAETGQIAFIVRKRVGGQVVLAEAFRLVKISA